MSPVVLLLDENLSEAVLDSLSVAFPGSVHVREALGIGTEDRAVWDHAKASGLVLVTRDQDFQRMSLLYGAPPRVIWLSGHNLSNARVVDTLRSGRERIMTFLADRELSTKAGQNVLTSPLSPRRPDGP